jgi:phosphatidylglycerophosphate synthase
MSARPTVAQARSTLKRVDAWWTVLVIDPIAVRILPLIAPIAWITPMRLTLLAGVLGIVPGLLFLHGALVAGAVAFQVRFLIDCLDGKLARMRGTGSKRGGMADEMLDVLTLFFSWAALASWVHGQTGGPNVLAPLLVAVVALQTLPREAGQFAEAKAGWQMRLARHRLYSKPSRIEVEAFGLTLAPALLGAHPVLLEAVLWLVAGTHLAESALHWAKQFAAADAGSQKAGPQPTEPKTVAPRQRVVGTPSLDAGPGRERVSPTASTDNSRPASRPSGVRPSR